MVWRANAPARCRGEDCVQQRAFAAGAWTEQANDAASVEPVESGQQLLRSA